MNGYQVLCTGLKSLFLRGYGDPQDSGGGDYLVPSTTEWQPLFTIGKPALLVLRTLDSPSCVESKEIYLAFNDKANGFRMPSNSVLTLDGIVGTLYVKPVVSTETVNVSHLIASVKVND